MSAAKSERLMNLLIMLLVQKRYVGKEKIRAALYPDTSDEAFEKMFERDKEELRSLGVPVEVGTDDAFFDDEPGYRIPPDQFQLPEVNLDADEAAVVSVATRVWDHAGLAQAAGQAGRKLAADGPDSTDDSVDLGALDLVLPRLGADEPSYEAFIDAAWTRTPVAFDYRRIGQEPVERHLEPWGVVRSSGRWYVVGLDTDRGEERVFRLSRVIGEPRPTGEPGSYARPAGVDAGDIVRRLAPPVAPIEATLLVRRGTGHALRRHAQVTEGVDGPTDDRWDRVVLSQTSNDLAAEVLSHGPDVLVVEPAELRDEVVRRLTEAAP
ncbi:helix-turn-helix transcriptional regulator [Nocardioides sp. Kera G14]|uniref:helix-turn-helix transcriptional regulator n=1 Tax=Nocardioides sp. Kera G14 TaxID=2884264 RepID=UPI001D1157A1|nr:WYL domain-containing protein [Nocardioides sp. Kera G14]UDY25201.1 WYL domain-containing protein [Nocardioides sp. Kera G14]